MAAPCYPSAAWFALSQNLAEGVALTFPELLPHLRPLIFELESAINVHNAGDIAVWIERLMEMPAEDRKDLSRDGAVRTREGTSDPVHWTDPVTKVRYFDPTNRIYARALRYACLYARDTALVSTDNWCEEKLGDIVECALAMAWRDPSPENLDFRSFWERIVYAVMRLDGCLPTPGAWNDHRLWASFADDLRIHMLHN